MKKSTLIRILVLLSLAQVLLVYPVNSLANGIYIVWTNSSGGKLTMPAGNLNTGGSLASPSISIATAYNYIDNGRWWCESGGQLKIGVCTIAHDTLATQGTQDNSLVCNSPITFNFNGMWGVWDNIDATHEQMGDFYVDYLPSNIPSYGTQNNDVDINSSVPQIQQGSCCGDDDSISKPVKVEIGPRWCIRPIYTCNQYLGYGTTVCSPNTSNNNRYNPPYFSSGKYYVGNSSEFISRTTGVDGLATCTPAMLGYGVGYNVCVCNWTLTNTTYFDDPDMGPNSCISCPLRYDANTPLKRDWNTAAAIGHQCCGDDVLESDFHGQDCLYSQHTVGPTVQETLCIQKPDLFLGDIWNWEAASSSNVGQIIDDILCTPKHNILSAGTDATGYFWLKCQNNTFNRTYDNIAQANPYTITGPAGTHQYLCTNDTNPLGLIYECCGDAGATCNTQKSAGQRHVGDTPILKDNVKWYCSNTGEWFREGSDDQNQFMCQTDHYNWSSNVNPPASYCCGDDHNGYYELNSPPYTDDKDGDGIISDCLNFTNNLNNKNNKLCIQTGGTPETILAGGAKDCIENISHSCNLDHFLNGIPQTDCCVCASGSGTCECTPLPCYPGEDCQPDIPQWKCKGIEPTINKTVPYAMQDPIDDNYESKWIWANASIWPGVPYVVSCAEYMIISEKNTTDSRWLSCTNYTISNLETGFYLQEYDYQNGKPVIDGLVDDSHKAASYVPNPYNISGPRTLEKHGYLCYIDNTSDNMVAHSLKECCNPYVEINYSVPQPGMCNSKSVSTKLALYTKKGIGEIQQYYFNKTKADYYCTSNYTWSLDLDNIDNGYTCNQTASMYGNKVYWTGTKCCGDSDDYPEFYDDANGYGACWNSTYQPNNDFLRNKITNTYIKNVYVTNGILQGCNLTGSSLKDYIPNNPIVDHNPCYTLVVTQQNYFCNYTTYNWSETPKPDTVFTYSSLPWDNKNFGCCVANQCWDGSSCVPNFDQDTPPLVASDGTEFRCVGGTWTSSRTIYTWDRESPGFCLTPGQCLVSTYPSADSSNDNDTYSYDYGLGVAVDDWFDASSSPVCINNTQYIADNYCDNGNWTSRTRFIATQLLNFAVNKGNNNYTLFCEDVADALPIPRARSVNRYDYFINFKNSIQIHKYLDASCDLHKPDGSVISNVLCANKICILKYNDKYYGEHILFGISLNVPINETPSSTQPSFLQVLGINNSAFCNNVLDSTNFAPCVTTGPDRYTVFYNAKLMSVIFSKYPLNQNGDNFGDTTITQESDWLTYFKEFIMNRTQALIDYLISEQPIAPLYGEPIPAVEIMINTSKFNRIFVDVKPDGKRIIALNEKVRLFQTFQDSGLYGVDEYIAINYTGFNTSICDSILRINNHPTDRNALYNKGDIQYNEINCSVSCSGNNCSYYVFSKRPQEILNGYEMITIVRGAYYGRYKWIGEDLWDELTQQLRTT